MNRFKYGSWFSQQARPAGSCTHRAKEVAPDSRTSSGFPKYFKTTPDFPSLTILSSDVKVIIVLGSWDGLHVSRIHCIGINTRGQEWRLYTYIVYPFLCTCKSYISLSLSSKNKQWKLTFYRDSSSGISPAISNCKSFYFWEMSLNKVQVLWRFIWFELPRNKDKRD